MRFHTALAAMMEFVNRGVVLSDTQRSLHAMLPGSAACLQRCCSAISSAPAAPAPVVAFAKTCPALLHAHAFSCCSTMPPPGRGVRLRSATTAGWRSCPARLAFRYDLGCV